MCVLCLVCMFFDLLGLFISLYCFILFLTERDKKLYGHGGEENMGGIRDWEEI